MLKPPGTKHLKLECGILLSTFAFKFNLRRCHVVYEDRVVLFCAPGVAATGRGLHSFPFQLNLSSSVHRITQLNS